MVIWANTLIVLFLIAPDVITLDQSIQQIGANLLHKSGYTGLSHGVCIIDSGFITLEACACGGLT